jgi:hypothetical protein
MGCLGRITECEALDDGGFNIILLGLGRFHIARELEVTTPFRQVEADVEPDRGDVIEVLAPAARAAVEQEARRFADHLGYLVDWSAVAKLDDMALVNGIAQVAPFDVAAKQSLLEADSLDERVDRVIQLMQFYEHTDKDGPATLQ